MRDGTERLQELLRYFFDKFAGRPTLYIIDDCSATKELTKKKDMLSQLAFSVARRAKCLGHFAEIYFGLEGPPGAGKVVCMFYTKDRDSFEYCLRKMMLFLWKKSRK